MLANPGGQESWIIAGIVEALLPLEMVLLLACADVESATTIITAGRHDRNLLLLFAQAPRCSHQVIAGLSCSQKRARRCNGGRNMLYTCRL